LKFIALHILQNLTIFTQKCPGCSSEVEESGKKYVANEKCLPEEVKPCLSLEHTETPR